MTDRSEKHYAGADPPGYVRETFGLNNRQYHGWNNIGMCFSVRSSVVLPRHPWAIQFEKSCHVALVRGRDAPASTVFFRRPERSRYGAAGRGVPSGLHVMVRGASAARRQQIATSVDRAWRRSTLLVSRFRRLGRNQR